MVSRRARG